MRNYLSRMVLAIAALLVSSLTFGQALNPVQASYAYELTAKEGRVNYIFGTTHVAASNVPVYLGQCVKDVIKKIEPAISGGKSVGL